MQLYDTLELQSRQKEESPSAVHKPQNKPKKSSLTRFILFPLTFTALGFFWFLPAASADILEAIGTIETVPASASYNTALWKLIVGFGVALFGVFIVFLFSPWGFIKERRSRSARAREEEQRFWDEMLTRPHLENARERAMAKMYHPGAGDDLLEELKQLSLFSLRSADKERGVIEDMGWIFYGARPLSNLAHYALDRLSGKKRAVDEVAKITRRAGHHFSFNMVLASLAPDYEDSRNMYTGEIILGRQPKYGEVEQKLDLSMADLENHNGVFPFVVTDKDGTRHLPAFIDTFVIAAGEQYAIAGDASGAGVPEDRLSSENSPEQNLKFMRKFKGGSAKAVHIGIPVDTRNDALAAEYVRLGATVVRLNNEWTGPVLQIMLTTSDAHKYGQLDAVMGVIRADEALWAAQAAAKVNGITAFRFVPKRITADDILSGEYNNKPFTLAEMRMLEDFDLFQKHAELKPEYLAMTFAAARLWLEQVRDKTVRDELLLDEKGRFIKPLRVYQIAHKFSMDSLSFMQKTRAAIGILNDTTTLQELGFTEVRYWDEELSERDLAPEGKGDKGKVMVLGIANDFNWVRLPDGRPIPGVKIHPQTGQAVMHLIAVGVSGEAYIARVVFATRLTRLLDELAKNRKSKNYSVNKEAVIRYLLVADYRVLGYYKEALRHLREGLRLKGVKTGIRHNLMMMRINVKGYRALTQTRWWFAMELGAIKYLKNVEKLTQKYGVRDRLRPAHMIKRIYEFRGDAAVCAGKDKRAAALYHRALRFAPHDVFIHKKYNKQRLMKLIRVYRGEMEKLMMNRGSEPAVRFKLMLLLFTVKAIDASFKDHFTRREDLDRMFRRLILETAFNDLPPRYRTPWIFYTEQLINDINDARMTEGRLIRRYENLGMNSVRARGLVSYRNRLRQEGKEGDRIHLYQLADIVGWSGPFIGNLLNPSEKFMAVLFRVKALTVNVLEHEETPRTASTGLVEQVRIKMTLEELRLNLIQRTGYDYQTQVFSLARSLFDRAAALWSFGDRAGTEMTFNQAASMLEENQVYFEGVFPLEAQIVLAQFYEDMARLFPDKGYINQAIAQYEIVTDKTLFTKAFKQGYNIVTKEFKERTAVELGQLLMQSAYIDHAEKRLNALQPSIEKSKRRSKELGKKEEGKDMKNESFSHMDEDEIKKVNENISKRVEGNRTSMIWVYFLGRGVSKGTTVTKEISVIQAARELRPKLSPEEGAGTGAAQEISKEDVDKYLNEVVEKFKLTDSEEKLLRRVVYIEDEQARASNNSGKASANQDSSDSDSSGKEHGREGKGEHAKTIDG